MAKQATGSSQPDESTIGRFVEWCRQWLWFYDYVGARDIGSLLETFEYAFKRYGINQFVVDSLVKLGVAHDDYDGQKKVVEKLCDFAANYPVHVHLVAHSRKAIDEAKRPGKLDVAGHADITNLAANGVTVWRNKSKERAIQGAAEVGRTLPTELTAQPDTVIDVWKQRDTGDEPSIGLAFNLHTKSYHPMNEGRHSTIRLQAFSG
jgi:twinkle protein